MIKFNKDIYLYDYLKHWAQYENIYIYSDPHFNDPEMKHLRKNYIGDDEQVKMINSVCHKNDILIILGDIGDASYVSKLKAGYKVLVKGNHDAGDSNYQRASGVKISYSPDGNTIYQEGFDNKLFDEVYDGVLALNDKVILSHEPIKVISAINSAQFMFNFHGHDHSKVESNDKYHFNCCAEHINYTPIRLSEYIKDGKLKHVESIHRLTIDRATENKNKRKVK